MLPEYIIYIGVLISLIGQFFYLKSIVLGSTKPNLISHFVWILAPFIGVFFQLKAGAGLSALVIFMAGFASFLIVVISLFKKNGYWKLNTFDLMCGIFSVSSLILYFFTHNLSVSILFAILSDSLACIPTIKKTWNFPDTETGSLYIGGIISNILGLLTITNWAFPIYSFSVSIIVLNFVVLFCIYRKKIFGPSSVSLTS